MWVKICANTNLHDAQLAAELGADAVGFVFAPSKRQMTSEAVAEIVSELPQTIEKVGVFTTDDPYEVEHNIACCGLTIAQLHRTYDAEMVRLLSDEFGGELKIMQAIMFDVANPDRTAAETRFTEHLSAALADKNIWAVLIDAAKGKTSGGLGLSFDWKRVGDLVQATNQQSKRVILAGGLTPENIVEAILAFRPWGVDVASGVEASPGNKNPQKLKEFLRVAQSKRN